MGGNWGGIVHVSVWDLVCVGVGPGLGLGVMVGEGGR